MKQFKTALMSLMAFLLVISAQPASAAEPLDEIRQIISNYYVEDVPDHVLEQPTAKRITDYLDPYSVYMSTEEYERFFNTIERELVGIGVTLEEDKAGIKVLSVIEEGPAQKAGLEAGDIITHAGGQSLAGESVQFAISLISGKAGTAVELSIIKAQTNEKITITMAREVIHLPNTETAMLGGGIGFLRLNSFAENSRAQIEAAIKSMPAVKGWIFDLRNNGGGHVTAAQEIAGFFPGVKDAFQLRDKSGIEEVYKAIPQKAHFTKPTHILINPYSASASEMLSASVKEQKGAVLYGQNSFGKGSMQTLFALSDNSFLKLTTAHFYSPKGTAVNKIGVKPDVITTENEELQISHRDQLLAQHPGYLKLPALNNVPVTKTFKVAMNMDMNWTGLRTDDVQLIQLGGQEVAVEVKSNDKRTMTITPKAKLQPKGQYLLLIHPKWTSSTAKKMAKGIYLEIKVGV
ncbi:S41 family peptidase [Bacillus infantis]|uniref:S41 family peptidase n=1 Tax=Bacillus infantis TaxID=324767 RepID=UPI002FBE31A2